MTDEMHSSGFELPLASVSGLRHVLRLSTRPASTNSGVIHATREIRVNECKQTTDSTA